MPKPRHLFRGIWGLLAVTALVGFFPSPASACSCAMPVDMETWVSEAPAAMVGTLVGVEAQAGPMGQQGIFRFQVEQWVKGDGLGETVDVHSVLGDGGNCGLFDNVGERVGLLLYIEEGHLTSNSCSMAADPDLMLTTKVDLENQGITPLGPDDGVEVVAGGVSTEESGKGSTELARVAFLGIVVAGLGAGVVAYLRRDRQVRPPSAF
jgi:hypothetical protein